MTIRTSESDDQRLTALAARWHVSKQAAILRAVQQAAERELGLDVVEDITRRILIRDADALARLADL